MFDSSEYYDEDSEEVVEDLQDINHDALEMDQMDLLLNKEDFNI